MVNKVKPKSEAVVQQEIKAMAVVKGSAEVEVEVVVVVVVVVVVAVQKQGAPEQTPHALRIMKTSMLNQKAKITKRHSTCTIGKLRAI